MSEGGGNMPCQPVSATPDLSLKHSCGLGLNVDSPGRKSRPLGSGLGAPPPYVLSCRIHFTELLTPLFFRYSVGCIRPVSITAEFPIFTRSLAHGRCSMVVEWTMHGGKWRRGQRMWVGVVTTEFQNHGREQGWKAL